MAHYATLNEKNVVTQVIVGKDETDDTQDWEEYYGGKRTSYNTHGGVHYEANDINTPSSDQTKSFRKNYAGIGYSYDAGRDAFIAPKLYPSWVLNESTCQWDAPTAKPDDGKPYEWDEPKLQWEEYHN